MKPKFFSIGLSLAAYFAIATTSWADTAKTYQVTGPVLEVTETKIVVQKGDDRWEIARDASTRGKEVIKVGDKVTIEYRMTATSVEKKPAGQPAKVKEKPAAK